MTVGDNMTDALAAPLGHLVIAFNDLEIAMGGALMHILRNDDEFVGTVFISVLGFSQKYALLKALAVKLNNTKKRDELLALLETARRLNEERNRYVHAGYTSIMGDNDQVMFVLHQRLKDFSKESLFRMNDDSFRYIKQIDSGKLVSLANDTSILASELSVLSEQFYI